MTSKRGSKTSELQSERVAFKFDEKKLTGQDFLEIIDVAAGFVYVIQTWNLNQPPYIVRKDFVVNDPVS